MALLAQQLLQGVHHQPRLHLLALLLLLALLQQPLLQQPLLQQPLLRRGSSNQAAHGYLLRAHPPPALLGTQLWFLLLPYLLAYSSKNSCPC